MGCWSQGRSACIWRVVSKDQKSSCCRDRSTLCQILRIQMVQRGTRFPHPKSAASPSSKDGCGDGRRSQPVLSRVWPGFVLHGGERRVCRESGGFWAHSRAGIVGNGRLLWERRRQGRAGSSRLLSRCRDGQQTRLKAEPRRATRCSEADLSPEKGPVGHSDLTMTGK